MQSVIPPDRLSICVIRPQGVVRLSHPVETDNDNDWAGNRDLYSEPNGSGSFSGHP